MVIALPLFFGVQILHADPLRLGLLLVPASFFAFLGATWGKRGIPISVAAMLAIVFSMAAPPGSDGDAALKSSSYFALGAGCYLITHARQPGAQRTISRADAGRHAVVDRCIDAHAGFRVSTADRARRPGGQPHGQPLRQQAALADQFQNARDIVLESPRTPRRQGWAGMLIQILEMRDHLLACGLDLELLIATPGHEPVLDALGQTLEQLADEIEHLADSLLTGRKPRPFASHRPRLQSLQWDIQSALSSSTDALPSVAILARGLADRVGHIDDEFLRLIALARSEVKPDLAVVRASWQMFTSPTGWSLRPFRTLWRGDAPPLRHAIRAALAIATGYAISLAMPWGTHDYWILLTIVVVLR
ncbi:MAG: FUSC family membrane protein, partial [Burkholderiaceae bacterium]